MRAFDPSVAPAHRISLFRRHGRKIHCVFTAAPRQSGLAGADRLRIWSSILRCFQKSDLSFFSAGGPTVPCHAKATKPCKKAGRKRPKSGQSTRKAGLWHSQDPRARPHFQCHPLHPFCRYRPQRMEGIIVSIRTGYAALPSHKICNFPEKERLARKAMLLALRCGRFYRLWQLSSSQAFRLSPPQNTPSFVSVKSRKAPFDAFLLLTPAVCLPLPP